MNLWRPCLAALLVLLLGLPLAWPVVELVSLSAWPTADTFVRVLVLMRNSALLSLGTVIFTVPAGILLAVLLERGNRPHKSVWLFLLLAPLFIPLPLFTAGWQAIHSSLLLLWTPGPWTPWSAGLASAVWLHSLAGLPWVVFLVRLGLRSVEPELEEQALLLKPPSWVLLHVTLPRSSPAIAAAGLWLVLQTLGEITITDLMQVRTFAEEINTQLATPEANPAGGDPLGRALAVVLAGVSLNALLIVWLARHVLHRVPPGLLSCRAEVTLSLGWWRPLLLVMAGVAVLLLLAVPLGGLLWRAGRTEPSGTWSPLALLLQLGRTLRQDGGLLLRTLVIVKAAGVLTTAIALVCCWQARESRWFRVLLLLFLAVCWAMPGPVVGLGFLGLFREVVRLTSPWASWPGLLVYHGPSPVPLLAVYLVRFLPFATAIVGPVVWHIPRGYFDAGRLAGLGSCELALIVWPLSRRACLCSVLAVAILSLGEVSASKLVSTPGMESFAESIWTQMHYGLSADLSARCLWLLLSVLAGAGLLAFYLFRGRGYRREQVAVERNLFRSLEHHDRP